MSVPQLLQIAHNGWEEQISACVDLGRRKLYAALPDAQRAGDVIGSGDFVLVERKISIPSIDVGLLAN